MTRFKTGVFVTSTHRKLSAYDAPLYISLKRVSLWYDPNTLSHISRLWIRIESRSSAITLSSSIVVNSVMFLKLSRLGETGLLGKGSPISPLALRIARAENQNFIAARVSLCSSKNVEPISSYASARRSGVYCIFSTGIIENKTFFFGETFLIFYSL